MEERRRVRRITEAPPRPPVAARVKPARVLDAVLLRQDPRDGLWRLVKSGWAEAHIPELPALKMTQDPIHRHKDVLAHTITVTAQSPPRLTVRLAALFHDIGKPATRSIIDGKVAFRGHEAVGAGMTRRRMKSMGYGPQITTEVARMVELSGRFKGYDSWTDSAVRRYVRDAGPLLRDLLDLVRADCTTRHAHKVKALHDAVDELEGHIERLARQAEADALRPEIDGLQVINHLGIEPGPIVGQALKYLLQLRRTEGELGEAAVLQHLDDWWSERAAVDAAPART